MNPPPSTPGAPVRLVTLHPGHFHAGLVQKFMYPQVDPTVHVYAPDGPELQDHLKRIAGFNSRADRPTHWNEVVYAGPDFLERMLAERAGNVVVLAGNNLRKTEHIHAAVRAGFHVLSDKPMAITPAGFALLREAFDHAAANRALLYDIMTERFEITSMLQRELARRQEIFGTLQTGTAEEPGVVMESVHHFYKEVAGKPLIRPGWYFDVRQQGEAIPDVGTHLIDLVQWECFPDQVLDWRKDVRVLSARRWPTRMTLGQFEKVTGLAAYPEWLRDDVEPDGVLKVFQNGDVTYTLRGVHARVAALWNFQAPPGTGDTHYSLLRGTQANLRIAQGQPERYEPTLYVEDTASRPPAQFEGALRSALAALADTCPGLELLAAENAWKVVLPKEAATGHESHFAQVTERFLGFLAGTPLPEWEVPNMLAKYFTTTEAYRLSHAQQPAS